MTFLTVPRGYFIDRVRRKSLLIMGGLLSVISTIALLASVSMPSLIASALIGDVS